MKIHMMLSPLQQAIELIQKSKSVLIALPENLNGDSLGSSLALKSALEKLNKKVDLVSPEAAPEKLQFLSGLESLKDNLSTWRDFIISIDTTKNKISRLRYEKENNILKIFLGTDQKLEERDVRLEPGSYYYDAIITLDAPDLESLGKIFEENTEIFFSKPIMNIDHKAANEYFGEINLVEPTAAACAEITAGLIEALGPDLIDQNSATALLTGLVSKTRSFQNAKTTPQALTLASVLVTRGAEQEKIIQHLYKTIPLNRLKLWGRLLSKIDFNQQKNTVWLWAQSDDFVSTQTSPRDLTFLLEEIDGLFPQSTLALILWADETNQIWALVRARQEEILQKMNAGLNGSLKGDKLLIKMSETSADSAKARLDGLINSLE